MSTTYSIACKDCKKQLWVAQSSQGRGYIYSGRNDLDALWKFLNEHLGHALVFGVDGVPPTDGCDEVVRRTVLHLYPYRTADCPICGKLIGRGHPHDKGLPLLTSPLKPIVEAAVTVGMMATGKPLCPWCKSELEVVFHT